MAARPLALLAALLLLASVMPALAQPALPSLAPTQTLAGAPSGFKRCGDENLVLVFLNPDLTPHPDDNLIHATGTFFIQFQARGDRALQVEKFTFSFGQPLPDGIDVCQSIGQGVPPAWVTDAAYIKDYRCDTTVEDGFFVPIDTYNVPDGQYGAAVSAYDKDGNELVRYYTKAIVENGRSSPNDPRDPTTDKVIPWPMILPGDGTLSGPQQDAAKGAGLYIEVAENTSSIQAFLNGALLQLKNATPPDRDDDVVPCLPSPPLPPESSEGQMASKPWGNAWTWDGIITQEDVVKVRVVDLNGNVAEKVVHIGDPTIGGRVLGGNPQVDIALDEAVKESDENGTAMWHVTYKTLSEQGLHADVFLQTKDGKPLPPGLEPRLRPNHVQMAGLEELHGTVQVTGTNATLGTYDLQVVVNFLNGETREQKTAPLTFKLTQKGGAVNDTIAGKGGVQAEQTRGTDINQTAAPPPAAAPAKKSPGPETPLMAAGLLAAALLVRRRRA
ncbi:MAG: hypothetical protein LC624_02615 [Halobacteriales archaeon]|nr:hypothetical protein [Halobacteriales archaeon]